LITTSQFNNNFTGIELPAGAQRLIDNGIANPNQGKLVPVISTKVTQEVKASNGDVIQGLEITILADDQSNNPSGETPSTTSTAPPAATTTKKGAAMSLQGSWLGMTLASALVLGFLAVV
jgi:hypothetical protein